MSMENDRDYWRCCSTSRLIEEARESDHELCIALGERLQDLDEADTQLEEIVAEREELRRRVRNLTAQLED